MMDIILILLCTLAAVPIVEFTQGMPRVIITVIVLLFSPGYSLLAALFPGRRNLTSIDRIGLALILSFALVSLTGLALNYTSWGIRLTPIVVSVTVLIAMLCGIAIFRRSRLPEDERLKLRINLKRPQRASVRSLDGMLSFALIIVVLGSLASLAYVIERPKEQEKFTNFYLLGSDDKMEHYPNAVSLNDEVKITLGIENHEDKVTSYLVKVIFDGQEIQTLGTQILADEEKWSSPVILKPFKRGADQKVEFLLYKDQGASPYLSLRLWLDVTDQ